MLTIELRESLSAPQDQVWNVVSDPSRQKEYVGYQVISTEQTNAVDLGAEYAWHEKGVLLGKRYECACGVLGWEPPQWFCFGTPNLFNVSFELDEADGATTLLYRVELPQTPESRREALTGVCQQTVRQLKLLLEGARTSG